MSRLGLQPSYWEQPGVACVPCQGRGWVFVEDASGAPTAQVTCPYCKGRRTTWWVIPNRVKRALRPRLIKVAVLVWLTYSLWPAHHFAAHMEVLVPLGAVLLVLWLRPVIWLRLPHRRPHAPGFTDAREGKALGIFAGVVGLRSLFGHDRSQRGF